MALTGAPPPLASGIAAFNATPEENSPAALVNILNARGPDQSATSVTDVLHAASGPGNIITGRVIEIQPDGNVFLATQSGAELSIRHPPEVPLQVGSTITLRLVATVPVPQAILLAVDGRSVVGLLGRAASRQAASPAQTPPSAPQPEATASTAVPGTSPAIARASGPTNFGIGLSTQSMLTLSQDQAAVAGGIGDGSRDVDAASTATPDPLALSEPIVAVLARGVPAKPGGATPPVGTRYLLTVAAISVSPPETVATTETPPIGARPDAASVEEPAHPIAPTVSQASPPPAEEPAPESVPANIEPAPVVPSELPDLTAFTPQTATLAGRVVAPRQPGESLIETGLGTLALPLPSLMLPVGSAVHLKVVAVARPIDGPAAKELLRTADMADVPQEAPISPQTTVQAALTALKLLPALAESIETLMVLSPGTKLAALIFGFLSGSGVGVSRRWIESPARAALDAMDRGDLRERLDTEVGTIGTTSPPSSQGAWLVTVLPFIGAASVQPARLYRRTIEGSVEEDGAKAIDHGQRFVIELELRRFGRVQFDGLVRDRRFDLALRTERPIDPSLQPPIHAIFRETVGIGGYAGELVFGKLGRFPLVPLVSEATTHEISA